MVFVLSIMALLVLGTGGLVWRTLSLIGNALDRINLLHDAVLAIDEDAAERSESLHKLTRRYIGLELLEKRVLPTIGWKPELPSEEETTFNQICNSAEFEQAVIEDARKQCEKSGIQWFGEANEA
jgi:hypothetical protein